LMDLGIILFCLMDLLYHVHNNSNIGLRDL
jgi:hypothetical protein